MIDFNNTWCEATEENYKALIRLDYTQIGYENKIATLNSKFLIPVTTPAGNRVKGSNINSNKRQIHLVNGKFQYVETKPKNNFKDYGFEAYFEDEILKEYENQFVGMVYQNEGNFGCSWDKKGRCLQPDGFGYDNMNLKPIKKEWYLNKDNFEEYKGKIIINKYGNIRMIQSIDENKVSTFEQNMYHDIIRVEEWRPATKEEILALLVKE